MNFNNKEKKLVDTIVGLYDKIIKIKKEQVYIKAFERDIDNSLKNLFPNLANSLNKTQEFGDWTLEILECNSESEVLDVLSRMKNCEQEYLKEKNFSNYTEEISNPIGDQQQVLHKQIELLKNRFDDIVVYLKDLEKEIIILEKKAVNSTLKNYKYE